MKAVEGWIKTQLGDVATLVKGISYASEDYCGPGEGAVFITIKCVSKAGGFKREGIKYFKGIIAASQVLQPGELLIANTDLTRAGDIVGCPMLVPTINGETITMSMDLSKIMEDDAKVDRDFLYYMLMTDPVRRFMKDHASGSTVLHLQTRAVPGLELEIPTSKPEQTKIAEILSTVDRAIEQTEAIIAKQQRIKTGLMQDLLTRGIDEHGNIRSEETHEFKDSPLGRIPVEWGAVPLKELCHIKHGYAFSGEFFTEQRNENVLLTPGNFYVKGGLYFTKDNTKYFTGPIPEEFILSNGDVLVVMTDLTKEMAILGRTVILYHPDNVLHNQRIGKVLKNRGVRLDLRFLALLMNSDFHRDSIKATATGTTVRHTSPEKLLSPLVPKLPFEEQVRIRKRIESIENLMNCTSKELAKARRIKTALMQDLLTGRKRVTALLTRVNENDDGKGVD